MPPGAIRGRSLYHARMESLEDKVKRVTAEEVAVVPYDPAWPARFAEEQAHLRGCLPPGLVVRIEHFGSTAVAGLAAKPIVDMVIEVTDVERAREVVPQVLEPQGYDCFWRPTAGDDTPPWFTWCIKRDAAGQRTHHLHFGAPGFKARELRFRDLLRARPDVAEGYGRLKLRLAAQHAHDRVAYTEAKTEFIERVMNEQ
jgi:GrpB-like predicted nucleotidyltransferase (UPF0157 family)